MNKILLVQEGKSMSHEGKRKGGTLQTSSSPQTLEALAPTVSCSPPKTIRKNTDKKFQSMWYILFLDTTQDSSKGIHTLHTQMHQP